jgi:CheY-like chemotaxis protein
VRSSCSSPQSECRPEGLSWGDAAARKGAAPASDSPLHPSAPLGSGATRAVVVTLHPTTRRTLSAALASLGFQGLGANSGQAALSLLDAGAQLLVIDHPLALPDGRSLLDAALLAARSSGAGIVAFLDPRDQKERERAFALGVRTLPHGAPVERMVEELESALQLPPSLLGHLVS